MLWWDSDIHLFPEIYSRKPGGTGNYTEFAYTAGCVSSKNKADTEVGICVSKTLSDKPPCNLHCFFYWLHLAFGGNKQHTVFLYMYSKQHERNHFMLKKSSEAVT